MRGGEGAPGNDSDHPAVLGRIYDAAGVPVTDSFMISQSLETWADRGSVAVLENGDFVVAWRGEDSGFWRRFDSDGTPLTEAVALDAYYVDLRAAAMPDGGFLITAMYSGYNPPTPPMAIVLMPTTCWCPAAIMCAERRVPDYETNYYAFPPEVAVLGNGQLLMLVEGHASWNGTAFEVMTWRQLAEDLGSLGDDTMQAGADGSALFGRAGADSLQGAGAADYLDGGAGDDTATGGAGNDTLVPSDGNDSLQGETGDDTFVSGSGDNTVQGGDGIDRLILDGVRASGVTVRGPADHLVITHDGNRTEVTGVEHFEFRLGSFGDVLTLEELAAAQQHGLWHRGGRPADRRLRRRPDLCLWWR
ncbi:calcium-binding protein [Rhodophyticola sp.]|uniref:calcium-binding protein n=1 Tax=Rhodophyticola sp. TaxID=2680032 RepID=UPI003D291A5B